jgi:hypothetical protein
MRHAASIAALTAEQMHDTPELIRVGVPAVMAFTAHQLTQAADSCEGLTGIGVENMFEAELIVADALIGVIA